MRQKSVLGAGLIAVDHIFLAKKKGDPSRCIGSSGGGSVSNALSMLSLLGYECSMFGVVGNDMSRYIAERDFQEFGINFSAIKTRHSENEVIRTRQYSHMIYENGKHEYIENCASCGSAFGRYYQIAKGDLTKSLTDLSLKTDVFVVDRANQSTITLARNVKKKNGLVAYDLNFVSHGNYAERIIELLGQSDVVKTDKKTLNQLMKYSNAVDILDWKQEFPNVRYLFVTDSSDGVHCFLNLGESDKAIHLKAIKNELVRDTGGAGDVFLAVILHQLISHRDVFCEGEFINMVNRAQALASLNCSLYGSRALQRFLLNNHRSPNDIMRTAEDLRTEGSIRIPLDPFLGVSQFDIRPFLISKKGICETCGWDKSQKRHVEKQVTDESISYRQMSEMLSSIPNAMYQSFEASLPYRDKLRALLEMNAIFVGSGGSLSASTFGEYLFLKDRRRIAKAVTPYELEGWDHIPEDVCIWLISHGGLNTDILGAAFHLENLGWKNVIVITGNKNSALAEFVDRNGWKMVLIDSMERNFVSTIGLLSQISTLSALLSTESQLEVLKEYFNFTNLNTRLKEYFAESQAIVAPVNDLFSRNFNLHIIAFARGWGWPSLTDLESKVIEGGICTIEISELKNYTHGRWMNLFGKADRLLVIYETPSDSELVRFFNQRFKKIPSILVKTKLDGVSGAVDLLFKTLLVANFIGKFAKKNILRPRFPKQGRGLYSWEPEYRKGKWKRDNIELTHVDQKEETLDV